MKGTTMHVLKEDHYTLTTETCSLGLLTESITVTLKDGIYTYSTINEGELDFIPEVYPITNVEETIASECYGAYKITLYLEGTRILVTVVVHDEDKYIYTITLGANPTISGTSISPAVELDLTEV